MLELQIQCKLLICLFFFFLICSLHSIHTSLAPMLNKGRKGRRIFLTVTYSSTVGDHSKTARHRFCHFAPLTIDKFSWRLCKPPSFDTTPLSLHIPLAQTVQAVIGLQSLAQGTWDSWSPAQAGRGTASGWQGNGSLDTVWSRLSQCACLWLGRMVGWLCTESTAIPFQPGWSCRMGMANDLVLLAPCEACALWLPLLRRQQ